MMGARMTEIDRFLGSVLKGRYRLLQRVAEGRRGGLYRAERTVDARAEPRALTQQQGSHARSVAHEPSSEGERVAVKLVHALPHQSQERFEQRFIQEVQTAGALGEHNTLIIHDYGHGDDLSMFVVMEWLSGVDLARLMALRGPLSARQALFLADQVLRSLLVAHARGVVHGDLTPEGLFISRGDSGPSVVKVMDFGRRRLASFSDEGQSLVGMPTGWARYLAPEQITGDDYDHRADLYSLGCILYEALSGERPFSDETGIGIWMAQVNDKPKPLSSHPAARVVPAEVEELVTRCLEKDPARRFESAAQLLALTSQLLR
jgi:eukaryotic-like serine/threonine-protein kinase